MNEGWNEMDALCRHHCAFALYRLPGEAQEPQFCMQEDGGFSPWSPGKAGFVFASFAGSSFVIRGERHTAPAASVFAPLPPQHAKTPPTSREEYHRLFSLYKAQLPQSLHKIVLARTEDVPAASFSPTAAFRRACELSPMAFNVLIHTPEHGTWLCSTPELLLRGCGDEWETMALAGTRPASRGDDAPWDAKNRREQQLVADYIHAQLSPLWEGGEWSEPHTVAAGAVEHLCTRFRFRMQAEMLGEVLHRLPPTPAVSGHPVETARTWLQTHPDVERGLYAGYLGPVAEGNVQLFVTLRCMRLYAGCCRLFAGGGLMPDSEEEAEWRETLAKMQAMKKLF